MNLDDIKEKGYKILPYTSTEEAFIHFVSDSRNFTSNGISTFLHNGREDPTTGLKPRELLCLVIVANVANFISGDIWVPGALVDSDNSLLPGDVAHDGFIKCVKGIKKDQYMWFEQVMATDKSKKASLDDIEGAILEEIRRKSSKGPSYGTEIMTLIVMVDYCGNLSDLKALSISMKNVAYKAIYLVAQTKNPKKYMCVILKSPGDTLGPISVSFSHPDGKADVSRMS